MSYNPRVALYLMLGLSYMHTTYSADDQKKQDRAYHLSNSYCPPAQEYICHGDRIPEHRDPRPRPQPMPKDYTFTEQLLKNEIRSRGVTAIRKRIQEATKRTDAEAQGKEDVFILIPLIAFSKKLYATSTDPLSRSIFDKASEKGAQAGSNIYSLDDNTYYRVLDDTRQTIECRTSIHDEDFIEKVIADIQKNG